MGKAGEAVMLVREETNPEDVHGMIAAKGVLTARGGATSHAAVVARQFGKVCVAGAENGGLHVNDEEGYMTAERQDIKEGDIISIDGTTGEVFAGAIALIEPNYEEEHDLITLLELGRRYPQARRVGQRRLPARRPEGCSIRRGRHRAVPHRAYVLPGGAPARRAADDPVCLRRHAAGRARSDAQAALDKLGDDSEEARRGRRSGEKGAGCARASQADKDYHDALDQLEEIQQGDFYGILKAMEGKPLLSACSTRLCTSSCLRMTICWWRRPS